MSAFPPKADIRHRVLFLPQTRVRSPEFELDVVHYLPHGGVKFRTPKADRAAEPLARRNGVAGTQFALLRPLSFSNGSQEMD